MGAGGPKRQPFCNEWERTNRCMRGEGAEPARIDNKGALGRPNATFEGKPVGGAMRSVRVQCDFALYVQRFWAAKRRPCVRLRGACEPFRAPGRALRRSRAATARGCPTRGLPQLCPASLEAAH